MTRVCWWSCVLCLFESNIIKNIFFYSLSVVELPICQKHIHECTCSASSLSLRLPHLCSPSLSNGTYRGGTLQCALHTELLPPNWLWGKFLVLLRVTIGSCPRFSIQLFSSHGCMCTDSLSRNTPSFHMGMPRLHWLMCYQVCAEATDKYGAVTTFIYCTS